MRALGKLLNCMITHCHSCGEQHSLAVTEFGDVYSWGRGREGQLGTGERKNSAVPTQVKTIEHEKISKAASGSYHNLVLTDSGRCYQFGKLHRFVESTSKQYFGGIRQQEELSDELKSMIEESMKTYLAGNLSVEDREEVNSNQFGNYVAYLQSSPILVEPLLHKRIVEVAAGYCFSIAISSEGEVFSWGFNEKGQLGHNHRFNIESPKKIESLSETFIIGGDCGYEHTALLDDKGHVYTVGLGVFGQLGHGDATDEFIPRRVDLLANEGIIISKVNCGSYYTCALTNNGIVYSWGHSEYGQHGGTTNYEDWQTGLGAGNSKEKHNYHAIPRILQGFEGKPPIKQISCGHLHSIVVLENNDVYSFGWGPCLGHGDRRFQLIPKQIMNVRGEPISFTACGMKHTLIVKEGSDTTFAFDYATLLDSKQYSDIEFEVEKKKINAHKVVIAARCPMLFKFILLHERFGPQLKSSFVLSNIRYPTFMAFLKYLYTDHLKVGSHLTAELGKLAARWGVPRLEELCKRMKLGDDDFKVSKSVLAENLEFMVNNKSFSDVAFIVQNQKIYAHRCILIKRCSYFERLLESNFKERDQKEFVIDESISPKIFLDILKYLYTGDESVINSDNCVELLHVADRFMMENLKLVIESTLLESLDNESVSYLLEVGDRYGAHRLKRASLEQICANKNTWDIVKSTRSFSELIKYSSVSLLREIDYRCSKANLSKPGEVLRMQRVVM